MAPKIRSSEISRFPSFVNGDSLLEAQRTNPTDHHRSHLRFSKMYKDLGGSRWVILSCRIISGRSCVIWMKILNLQGIKLTCIQSYRSQRSGILGWVIEHRHPCGLVLVSVASCQSRLIAIGSRSLLIPIRNSHFKHWLSLRDLFSAETVVYTNTIKYRFQTGNWPAHAGSSQDSCYKMF